MAFDGRVAGIVRALHGPSPDFVRASTLLRAIPSKDLVRVLTDLKTRTSSHWAIFGHPMPREFRLILSDWRGVFRHDANWCVHHAAAELRVFGSAIQTFVKLEREFNRALMLGEYVDGLAVLDRIEEQVGLSVWALEARLSLLELHKGVDQQKKYSQSILGDRSNSSMLKTFAYYLSLKAEKAAPVDRYLAQLHKQFAIDGAGRDSVYFYYHYHLGFFSDVRFPDLTSLMLMERGTSIVDRYLTFLRIAQIAVADPEQSGLRASIATGLTVIADKICDARIECLCLAYGVRRTSDEAYFNEAKERGDKFLGQLDAYTQGRYESYAAPNDSRGSSCG